MARCIGTLTVLLAGVNVLAGDAESAEDSKKGDPLHPRVKMETTLGDMILELDAEKAPGTVMNFVKYAEDKFYDGTVFHRVMKDFMIQGGGFTSELEKQTEGLRPAIRCEWKNGLKNVRGSVAMARLGGRPDSATAQFFINVVDNSFLDKPQQDGAGYAVFGRVVEGIEMIDEIRNTPVKTHPKYGGGRQAVVPVEPVVIKSVRLISKFDREKAAALAKVAEEKAAAEEKTAKETAGMTEKKAKADRAKKVGEFVKKTEDETGKKAVTTPSGLMYVDLKEGDGSTPEKTDRVKVHYTGWLLDGTKFDSSVDRGQPFGFGLSGGVIKGWQEGVATMKVGGKRKLIIPPELGYGKRGSGAVIPPDAVLVFDVELISIEQ